MTLPLPERPRASVANYFAKRNCTGPKRVSHTSYRKRAAPIGGGKSAQERNRGFASPRAGVPSFVGVACIPSAGPSRRASGSPLWDGIPFSPSRCGLFYTLSSSGISPFSGLSNSSSKLKRKRVSVAERAPPGPSSARARGPPRWLLRWPVRPSPGGRRAGTRPGGRTPGTSRQAPSPPRPPSLRH